MPKNKFYRLEKLPEYVFAELDRLKLQAIEEGRDVIDFGMGNPDGHPNQKVIDKLTESANDPTKHGYSCYSGSLELKQAHSRYYKKRFNVDLEPKTEVIISIGSKEGISSLACGITAPGDSVIVPMPCYPIHMWSFIMAEGQVIRFPNCSDEDELYNRYKKAIEESPKKPLAIIVNYPSNPTTYTVTAKFYERIVALCLKHKIYIISDLAYSEIYFEEAPTSILEIPGAKEITVEFTTVSKTYSMAGWRVGFAAGCPELIASIAKVKSFTDYGIFIPIQDAVAYALNNSDADIENNRKLYRERRDIMVSGLNKLSWNVTAPTAGMFLWCKIPEKFSHLNSMEFSKFLLDKTNVVVSPGTGFGEEGEGYVRFSLIQDLQKSKQALKNLAKIFN
jgi:alanine-synthesizing transaminase